MKKVLIISYFFPPIGASQRTLKFVKYLPSFGYLPIVLAPEKSNYIRKDPTMLDEIPANCKVIRLPSCEAIPGNPFVRKEDFAKGWYPQAIKAGLRIIEKEKIDIIYTTAPPNISHIIGLNLKKLTNTPWVADFRDEWTTNPFIKGKFDADLTNYNQRLEKHVLSVADGVISVSDHICDILNKLSGGQPREKFHTIMNGYDPMDFTNLKPRSNNKKFTICYMGSLYGIRKIFAMKFFTLLEEALKSKVLNPNEIELLIVGDPVKQIGPTLTKITRNTGYIHHNEALTKAASADLLLLLINPQEGNQTVTSKIFELINLKKPILALVPPQGVPADIIRKTATGTVIDSSFPERAIDSIKKSFQEWKTKSGSFYPNFSEIQKYSRKTLTSQLVNVMNNTLSNK